MSDESPVNPLGFSRTCMGCGQEIPLDEPMDTIRVGTLIRHNAIYPLFGSVCADCCAHNELFDDTS